MNKPLPLKERCQQSVPGEGPWGAFHSYQCYKKFTVIRDGKRYCKVHDPEYVNAKIAEVDRKHQERRNKKRETWKRNGLLNDIFEGIETDTIEHNLTAYKDAVETV